MGARDFLDRLFRGNAVSDEDYAREEDYDPFAEEATTSNVIVQEDRFRRTAAKGDSFGKTHAMEASLDNLVDFAAARAVASVPPEPPTGDFVRSGSFTEPKGFDEFSGKGGGYGGGSGSGFGGGTGKGSGKTETADAYVVFKRLKDFQAESQVADRLIDGKIVILNLESCDQEVARRVMDFIGGVAYACSSMVKRIAGRVFMITPKGVSSDGEFFDEARGGAPDIRYED